VAFSRLAANKDYVQDHLLKQAQSVYEALEANGLFYVCGDAKHMAKDVHRTLHQVIQLSRKCGTSEAEAYVKALQTSGRYMQDVW
jgi:NADPH-ferrihemoprotein reductase